MAAPKAPMDGPPAVSIEMEQGQRMQASYNDRGNGYDDYDGTSGNGTLAASRPVVELPLSIQRGFRVKMLTILFLQLCLTLAVGFSIRYAFPNGQGIEKVFPAQSGQAFALLAAVILTFPMMLCVKERHPWNMWAVFGWSLLLGVFLAASQIDGGFILSNSLFIILGLMTVGVACLLFLSLIGGCADEEGEPKLISFGTAGLLAYMVMIAAMVVFYVNFGEGTANPLVTKVGHFVGACGIGTLGFVWFCHESTVLCSRMEPDQYMKGVVYFYTDLVYVCLCCAVVGCVSGSGGSA